jgi:ATP-dependent Clp protease protease subunit
MDRRIILSGEIDSDKYYAFSTELNELESGTSSITLELSSDGGDAYYALAIAGRIRNSSCDIIIHGYGLIASAAVLILASGDFRYLAKEAWVMVHEDSISEYEGTVSEMEKTAVHYRRLEEQWVELLAERTTANKVTWTDLHKAEKYLTAPECLKLGLADKLI